MKTPETFLDRIIRIVRQKLAANARRLDEPAEAIDVVLAQHLEAINRARADLAAVAVGEKRLTMLLDEIDQRHTVYLEAAASAVAHRDDRAARTAMVRAVRSEHLRAETKANLDDVVEQRRQVEAIIEEMRAYYDRLRVRRETVQAMASAARAVASGNESMSALGPEGASREVLLENARNALADLRARALALTDLRKSGAIDAVGAAEFDGGPPIDDAEIERRLCELREAKSEE